MKKTFKTVPVAEHHVGEYLRCYYNEYDYAGMGTVRKNAETGSFEAFTFGGFVEVSHVGEEVESLGQEEKASLLDQFAIAAMQGLIADGHVGRGNGSLEQIAELAYDQAEAMMKERSKR